MINLLLGLQMATAPRRIRAGRGVSKQLHPQRSLIAGCGQAVDCSRLALYEVLEAAHSRYKPLQLQTWVDDLGHQEHGVERVVEARMVAVSRQLVGSLRAEGFVMSDKSALLASNTRLGRATPLIRTRSRVFSRS